MRPASLVLVAAAVLAYPPRMAAAQEARRAGDVAIETRSLNAGGRTIAAEVGRLWVSENRARPESRLIELAFVRLKSPAGPRPPLVYLAGGPGGSSTQLADNPSALGEMSALLEAGDLIFLDQRATGRSRPRLRWRADDPVPERVLVDRDAAVGFTVRAAGKAAAHFRAEGADLDGYNSREAADDIDALRRALGLERVSLFGFSYGTHLAIATMRRHGPHLADVVLIGVEGPDHNRKLPLTMDTQFRKLGRIVAADPDLGPRIPDLVALLERVYARLEREPMVVELTNPGDGSKLRVPVGKFGLQLILRFDIGDASDLPVFPRLLWSIDQGDPSVLQWFVQKRYGIFTGADLMALATDGASGASPERWATIRAQAERSLFGNVMNLPWPDIDSALGVADLGEEFRAPLVSDVRTLILSGSLDWNTPPFQAEEVRWGLRNATHISVENAGHEQILPQPAIQQAIVRFLKGEDVRDVRVALPTLRFVPLEGTGAVRHPSVR